MDLNFIHIAKAAEEAAVEAQNNGVVALFGLNLKLFIAQLVNFAIVLFVLWKWVFKPVTKGLESRTKRIEKSLQDAENIEKDKQEFEEWKKQEISKARQEATQIISQAKEDAVAVKNDITQKAQEEKAKIIAQAEKELGAEKDKAIGEIKKEMADLVVAAAEKVLRTKLDSNKDNELIKQSIKEAAK